MRKPPIFGVVVALALAACGLDIIGISPASPEETGPGAGDSSFVDGKSSATDGRGGPGSEGSAPDSGDSGDRADANPCAACIGTGAAQRVCMGGTECVSAHRVFITSTGSTAKLGGVDGADAKCQSLADAVHLGGTWRAWLSTGSSSKPNSRFTMATKPYRLLDGTLVANNYADLTSGSIRAKIQIDETGKNVGNPEVWTGTATNGNGATTGCGGFNDDSDAAAPATVGVADQQNGAWTNLYEQFCNRTTQRLYCFEQ
jgi:hypothetical protein